MTPTLAATVRLVQSGQASPLEMVQDALERAGRWEGINAFSSLHAEQALEEARARGEALARGEPAGELEGVPVAVKDLFDVAGWETTGCCAGYRGRIAHADAAMVSALRAAGAIVIGKTNQHELAAGGTNEVSACGPARNPWDAARITGGSSGGSAAAVAAGVVPLALGSDTGGSIRIPGSLCGVAGLKPGYGGLPMEGAMPLAPSLDTPGPMARSAEDLAVAYAGLAGLGASFLDAAASGIGGLRIGRLGGFFDRRVLPEVDAAVHAAAGALEAAGAVVDEAPCPDLDDAPDAWNVIAMAELAAEHGDLLGDPGAMQARTRESMAWGSQRSAVEYLEARRRASQVREEFRRLLREWDVLVAPATLFAAPPLGRERVGVGDGETMDVHRGGAGWLTRPVSLTLLPVMVLPVGFVEGLPVGMQLVAREGDEVVLLRAGRAYQEATEHHLRLPSPEG